MIIVGTSLVSLSQKIGRVTGFIHLDGTREEAEESLKGKKEAGERGEETEEVAKNKMDAFEKEAPAVVEHYEKNNVLKKVSLYLFNPQWCL